MKTYAPQYYKKFHCIADKCKHSCCIGWDVYIDEETQQKYITLGGSIGNRVRKTLCQKEDGICFAMKENGKCPFLNEKGLCDIILEKGEDYISDICREHPRFYNFFSDRREVGLGLSCEEAARIILSYATPAKLTVIDEDNTPEDELWEDEAYILQKRSEVFDIIRDRQKDLDRRIEAILDACDAKLPQKTDTEWAELLFGLERLDPVWEEYLKALSNRKSPQANAETEYESAFENLLFYFLYRHTSSADDERDFAARVSFSCLSLKLIRSIFTSHGSEISFEKLCDIARMYSAEIEYSEENTEKLIDMLA